MSDRKPRALKVNRPGLALVRGIAWGLASLPFWSLTLGHLVVVCGDVLPALAVSLGNLASLLIYLGAKFWLAGCMLILLLVLEGTLELDIVPPRVGPGATADGASEGSS